MRKKCQNLGHLHTTISQARNKLLTNFQRLQSTTVHGHMVCVKKSDKLLTDFQRLESTTLNGLLYFTHFFVILDL